MTESGGRSGLFRKKSLERLSSPEKLDQLLEVVARRSWVPLAAVAILVFGLVGWSVFARIPINVEGRGILVRPRKIVEFQSPGPGRVVACEVAVGDTVRHGQLLAVIDRPDLREQLKLKKIKAAELVAQSEPASSAAIAPDDDEDVRRLTGPSLRDHVERSRAHADKLLEERLDAIEADEQHLIAQQRVARDLSRSLEQRLEGQRKLARSELVSRSDVDQTEEDWVDSLERLYEIESQLRALETQRLEAEDQYLDRLKKIAEWDFDLQQRIADVGREIAELQQRLDEEGHVVSDHAGRILELNVAVGTYLEAGDRVGSMEVTDPTSPLMSVSYFRVKDGKRLQPGLEIRITPDTVKRERYGSILGEIRSVSSFPVSLEEATSIVGNRVVAQTLIEGGYLIAVSATLRTSAANPDRLEWTSSAGPHDVVVTSGTTTTARAAVERERPIAFVIPLLRSAAGVD